MKNLGIAICVIGSFAAILFVPLKFLGISAGWHFVLGDAGMGIKNYQLIDSTLLLIELLVINGIGITLYFVGKSKEQSNQ